MEISFWMGADPELFLRDIKTGKLRSAIPVIKEGKHNPKPLKSGSMDRVLHDNVLIEFNTTPAETADRFVSRIGTVLKEINAIAEKAGTKLHLQASAKFPRSQLTDEEARVFGCDADYDAWELTINSVPGDAATKTFRSAGGHLHIGGHKGNEKLSALLDDPYGKVLVVKALDVFVGLLSVFLDKDDTSPARRKLYGKAGAHRPKPYGVEYRACSSWWLASPRLTKLVYNLSARALQAALDENGFNALVTALGGEEKLIATINNSDKETAYQLYEQHIAPLLSAELKSEVEAVYEEPTPEFNLSWAL